MTDEQVIAGDELLRFLAQGWQPGCTIRIAPAPSSWEALKPELWRFVEERRRRGEPVPRFAGHPLCAFGGDYLELDVIAEPARAAPPPCASCRLRPRCSPADRLGDELQPFSGLAPLERWQAFHARFSRQSGLPYHRLADALVEAHLGSGIETGRRNPITLEPSLQLDDGLAPVLRLAVFHGPTSSDERGRARTMRLLRSFVELHRLASTPVPAGLVDELAAHAPFAFPIGFEARPDQPLLLKAYVEWHDADDEHKRTLASALAQLAGAALPADVPWCDVDLLGLGSSGGRLASLKLYVRRDPALGWPSAGLPAVPLDHPLMRLSHGRAYAVVDLRHVAARPPKWDFELRRQLIAGTRVGARLASLVSPEAARALDAVLRHHDFHSDAVAAGLRDGRPTIYLDLS